MSTAAERFAPLTSLKSSPSAPMVLRGITHAWEVLEKGAPGFFWFERLLPVRYRLALSGIEGLEEHSALAAEGVPAAARSAAWKRLVARLERPAKDSAELLSLIQVLAQACLYRDVENLAAKLPVPKEGARGELESNLDYWRAFHRYLLYEGTMPEDSTEILDVARRAPAASRIRLLAAHKHLILGFERSGKPPQAEEARALAEQALKALRPKLEAWEADALESKHWRTVCYVPFLGGDEKELEKILDKSEETARRCLEGAGKAGETALAYAQENLHAVLATRSVTLMRLKRPERAAPWFEKMIALDPTGAWQRLGLGKARLELGKTDAARADLEAAFELAAAEREECCQRLADCEQKAGRAARAKEWKARGEALAKLREAARTAGSASAPAKGPAA